MPGWFGPRLGSNAGYSGVWVSYAVVPVRWQGWLVTLIYGLLQVLAGLAAYELTQVWGWPPLLCLAPLPLLHFLYLWFASRHYVTYSEMDPQALPYDLRPAEWQSRDEAAKPDLRG